MSKEHFFFYGTLRPGQHNYFALLHDAKGVTHVGLGRTVERYTMLASGYPFVLRCPASTRIRGDVFAIRSREVVAAVDELEGHTGRARGYRREPVDIELDAGGRIVCWMYLYYGTPLAEEVPDGDWLALSAR
ncbi:MAG: gamma-glutamylcyclotransferase [Desulfovibrio sp.]|nr:gamma-glutamylcyclotransferase [Desulfovibrio sp.]MBI4960193.1 gamma-glutamylcyclotransferase [Desulfovibrio sp.]